MWSCACASARAAGGNAAEHCQLSERKPVWSKYQNGRKRRQLFPLGVASRRVVRYLFAAINGAHRGGDSDWARILAYVTGTADDQELLTQNEYLRLSVELKLTLVQLRIPRAD